MNLPKSVPTTHLGKRFAKRLSEHQFERLPAPADENDLDKLFNKQANKLLELQFDKHAPVKEDIFWQRIWQLRALAHTVKIKKNCIPFLIVIPRTAIPLQEQASLLNIDCRDGSKLFTKDGLINLPNMETPRLPYLAINVNIGKKFAGLAPVIARKKFNRWWRWNKLLPFTIDEGFAIATYSPKVIQLQTIDLIGTKFGAHGIPGLLLQEDGVWIVRRPDNRGDFSRAPAFCHDRIIP